MCAVMGPSGAGKTTLLDIISKRKTEGKVLGKVRKHTAARREDGAFSPPRTAFETPRLTDDISR